MISYNPKKIRVHDKVEAFGKQLAQHVAQHSAIGSATATAPAAARRVLTAEQQERIRQKKEEVRCSIVYCSNLCSETTGYRSRRLALLRLTRTVLGICALGRGFRARRGHVCICRR